MILANGPEEAEKSMRWFQLMAVDSMAKTQISVSVGSHQTR